MTVDQSIIAVLGTGTIGAAIAKNIAKCGYDVRTWNRTFEKAQALATHGVTPVYDIHHAVKDADIIITVLKDGQSTFEVLSIAAPSIPKGAIWLQLGTVGDQASTQLAQFANENNIIFFDAPILGSKKPAEDAALVVLVSGPSKNRNSIQPILDSISRSTFWISEEIGPSSQFKMVINHWVFTLTHGIAESLLLAEHLGLDPNMVLEILKNGPLDNAFMQAKASAMLSNQFESHFTIENAIKDASLITEAAFTAGLNLNYVQASLQRFKQAETLGYGDKDMSATFLVK